MNECKPLFAGLISFFAIYIGIAENKSLSRFVRFNGMQVGRLWISRRRSAPVCYVSMDVLLRSDSRDACARSTQRCESCEELSLVGA